MLSVFTVRGEDALVRSWLQGRHVSRGDIMAASNRQEEAARVEMIKQGIPPPGTTGSYFNRLYGHLSEFAHHRRRQMLDQVSIPARVMAVGQHPDWRARATVVDNFGWFVVELNAVGGNALGRLLGLEWFLGRFQPTRRALVELKQKLPLADIAAGEAREVGAPIEPDQS